MMRYFALGHKLHLVQFAGAVRFRLNNNVKLFYADIASKKNLCFNYSRGF